MGDFHIKFFERKRRRMEFGHALHPKVWGTGFTYEVLDGVQKVAKKLKIILWCKIEEENISTWKSIGKMVHNTNGLEHTSSKERNIA